jgi:hypothetical protein
MPLQKKKGQIVSAAWERFGLLWWGKDWGMLEGEGGREGGGGKGEGGGRGTFQFPVGGTFTHWNDPSHLASEHEM